MEGQVQTTKLEVWSPLQELRKRTYRYAVAEWYVWLRHHRNHSRLLIAGLYVRFRGRKTLSVEHIRTVSPCSCAVNIDKCVMESVLRCASLMKMHSKLQTHPATLGARYGSRPIQKRYGSSGPLSSAFVQSCWLSVVDSMVVAAHKLGLGDVHHNHQPCSRVRIRINGTCACACAHPD